MLFSVRYNFVYDLCNCWRKFQKVTRDFQVNKGIEQTIYNHKREEKSRKPQFSLNFRFNFGEEEEMQPTRARFVRLRNMANLRSGTTNADFFTSSLF